MVRRTLITAVLIAAFLLVVPAAAWAYDETGEYPNPEECYWCHSKTADQGPHGGYVSTSNSCGNCHLVHRAETLLLFPGETLTETCGLCHDGTGGKGVYGALAARGVSVNSAHRTETTSTVPGGDAATGGSATRVFGGYEGTLSCGDCHSAHGADTVNDFVHDRARTETDTLGFTSNQILRRTPGGASVETSSYGSDWCAACHQGRAEGVHDVINHPVDAAPSAEFFTYQNVQVVEGVNTTETKSGTLGRNNFGYVMPWPRSAGQGTHPPICQQCHEDERSVGDAGDGTIAADEVFTVTTSDGGNATDNPRFQVFPHESSSTALLIEASDDLCTNCHSEDQLP